MARIKLSDIAHMGDVALPFRWQFTIVTPPAGVSTFISTEEADVRAVSADLPKKTGTSVSITLKGHTVKQPGIYKPSGSHTITFIETVDNKIASWLTAWQQACWADDTGTRLESSDLKATFKLIRLDSNDKPIWFYQMEGCYYEDGNPGALDRDGTNPIEPQLTYSFDDFTQGPVSG